MAYIYLSQEIPLPRDQEEQALEFAKEQFGNLYSELIKLISPLEKEVAALNPNWTVETWRFDPEMVNCDDWHEGIWVAGYMFEVSIKSPDGDPDCDFQIDAWDEWRMLDKPMYKDVFEPLQKCSWRGFKRYDVTVEFSAINVVDSYSGNGIHVYNNSGWL
jgi:hypothetical protein